MEEDDPSSSHSETGSLIDRFVAMAAASLQGVVEVRYAKTDMVNARSAFRYELPDRAVGGIRLQEFDVYVAQRNGNNCGPVGCLRW